VSGLDDLQAQRDRATRKRVLPPKRAPRESPVELAVEKTEETPAVGLAAETATPPRVQPPAPVSLGRPAPSSAQANPPIAEDELAKYSVYFDAATDDQLTDVIIAGRKHRPKIVPSRSAVVRLALTSLFDRMTPDEIVAELAKRAPARTGTGRQRL
jgi:hypothetical protein